MHATYTYCIDNASGQVDACGLTWGTVSGLYLQGAPGPGPAAGHPCARRRAWLGCAPGQATHACPAAHSCHVLAPLAPAEVTDAFDIWVEATGQLYEAECEADEEERAACGLPPAAGASWRPVWRVQAEAD